MIPARALDDWLRGLPADVAARALLAAGLRWDELGVAFGRVRAGLPAPVTRWTLDDAGFRERRAVDPAALAQLLQPLQGLRLAVTTSAPAPDVARRLLRAPDVASAFVAVERPATALRRRPWHWPLRVGLVGFPPGAADDAPDLVDLTRVEEEPGAVDVAVLAEPLLAAVTRLVREQLVANAVVVLDAPAERAAVVEALLATARAATGASASALLPPRDVPALLASLVREASHANAFDVALTHAAGRELLLWAEPEAMERATLPVVAQRTAREVARAPAPTGALESAAFELNVAAEGAFTRERDEATAIAGMTATVEPELDAMAEERWCQITAGPLHAGVNTIGFFIGPREAGAQPAPAPLDESALPWEEEDATAYRLTVLFIPWAPDAVAQQAELELPRFGRTETVDFTLEAGAGEAAARILVLFRNRILQAAHVSARVGDVPTLSEVVALVPSLSGLDDRRPFDLALFANHTGGRRTLTRHSSGTTHVSSAGGVPAIAERIAAVLGKAALDRRRLKDGARSPAAREFLVALAVHGRDLYKELRTELGELGDPVRIQLVTARSSWLLPLEAVYEREAPDDDAQLCENYAADPATCTGACTRTPPRRSVCPNAFWGLAKTIERHRYDPDRDPAIADGYTLVASKRPRRGRRDLTVQRALFGASRRVTADDTAATVAALGHEAVAVAGWDAWEAALAGQDTQLLVLLPHTDYREATLEIAASTLQRGRIEARHVTGDRDVDPILILFGCRTSGTGGDPGGFATRFLQEGARAVFHSAADLRAGHASELARRLTATLTAPGHRPRMLSDALLEFRRAAVLDGYVAALGISAFGDADWRV